VGAGVVDDNAIQWKYGYHTIWPHTAKGLLEVAGVQTSLGAGGAVFSELSLAGSELSGLAMETGDELYDLVDLMGHPGWMMDLTRDIQCQIVFDGGATGGRSGIVWKAFCKGLASGVAMTDVLVSPDGSITFASFTEAAVVSGIFKTEWKPFNVSGAGLATDSFLGVCIELDADGTASADELKLICARLKYTIAACDPSGRRQLT
jgi:hypothetical protein